MSKRSKISGALIIAALVVTLMVGIWATTSEKAFGLSGVEAAQASAATSASIKFYNGNNQEIGSWRPFPLDRVARGGRFTVKVTANRYPVFIRVMTSNSTFKREGLYYGSFSFSSTVPSDTSFDNPTVSVFNHHGNNIAERRLPIGRK